MKLEIQKTKIHTKICFNETSNLWRDPKNQVSFLKIMGCREENQLLGGDFYAILDEMDANILQNTK